MYVMYYVIIGIYLIAETIDTETNLENVTAIC